ncbi:MAG: hypothetical protein JW708_10855 [Vallitaleaceae bacterium]|nr:hypothetical protein [Vallitaleaceae bacterium]
MRTKDIVQISLLSASLTAGKLALSFIPNVEIVSFLFIMYTIHFGFKKTSLASVLFVTTEMFIYGFGTWIMVYYVIWFLLVVVTAILKNRIQSEVGWGIFSAGFGLIFGLLFAFSESFFYGIAYGIQYWIRGIPFDALHMVSNYIVMIILYKPISAVFKRYIVKNVN